MNTKGHESVADTAGVPLLQQAFEANGQKSPRLAGFYFGNWLADVSQLVDPVAYSDVLKETKEAIDRIIDDLSTTTFVQQADQWFHLKLDQVLAQSKKNLFDAIDNFVLADGDPRRSRLAEIIRTSFRLKGYFKFAHPQATGASPPMNTDCFFQIFDQMYTQYYPAEHLDRPEVRPQKKPPEYVISKDKGTRASHESIEPDLYHYLRDDLEICAGLLGEVDSEWAQKTFGPTGSVNDNDLEWNLGLAKLGRALHMVEDFFAHSNFIEHAAKLMGEKFIPWDTQLPDIQLFQKRLKAYLPATFADWKQYPNEDYVVTGYFDGKDTIISLSHEGLEYFGVEAFNPLRAARDIHDTSKEIIEHPEAALFEAEKIMDNTFEFLENPEQALNNPENKVAQKLKDKFEPDLIKLRRERVTEDVVKQIFKEFPVFQGTDPRAKADIINYVLFMNRLITAGKLGISAYKAIKSCTKFIEDPFVWLIDQLKDTLKEKIKQTKVFLARELVFYLVGRDRIGCHSLLAKDHGDEWLFPHMKNCATAVHGYIVTTLTRWSDKNFRIQVTKSPGQKWIDWLELLEFFLRHPKVEESNTTIKRSIGVNIIHVVKDGDMLSNLAIRYKPTSLHPEKFSWETIANANFNTYDLSTSQRRDVVNKILDENKWGYPVRKPNYAFNTGLHVIIPDQKLEVEVASTASEKKWYMDVMEKKDWRVFRGLEDATTKQSTPGKTYHKPVYFKNKNELDRQIDKGKKLRLEAEKAYRP